MSSDSVLIGDLIKSKNTASRQELQNQLRSVLQSVNEKYGKSSLGPAEITRGDEFEGAYRDPSVCFQAYREIELLLYPHRIRGGIGVGSIDTRVGNEVSLMDGPAFHRAREAMEKITGSNPNLIVKSGNQREDETLNSLLNLVYVLKNQWTERQWEVIEFYLRDEKQTHESVAKHFQITQPAVSKLLSRAHLEDVLEAEKLIEKRLKELGAGV